MNQSGYQYKKGKSRSKVFGEAEIPVKRPKLDKGLRLERIAQIQEEVATINQQITFKQKRIDAAIEIKNFKLCDSLSNEIDELQQRRRELNSELKLLQRKTKKHVGIKTRSDYSHHPIVNPVPHPNVVVLALHLLAVVHTHLKVLLFLLILMTESYVWYQSLASLTFLLYPQNSQRVDLEFHLLLLLCKLVTLPLLPLLINL